VCRIFKTFFAVIFYCSRCYVWGAVCCADIDDRKVKLKVEIKPVSPSLMSADNVSDIRNLVKGLHISTATPTVHQLCFLSLASALNVLN